jgi:hypothetical protein
VVNHRHAVIRDLCSLGFSADTPIGIDEVVAIIMASPPGSAVRYAIEDGWSHTDHLLANLAEQGAGLSHLPKPYQRPGATPTAAPAPDPGPLRSDGSFAFSPMTVDDFKAQRERRAALAETLAATEKSQAS